MLFLCSSLALANRSVPQEFSLSDEIDLFNAVEVDSGWIPSSGVISLRFQTITDGGISMEMEGTGELEWPENDLELSMLPAQSTGIMSYESWVGFVVSLRFDIGIYSWEGEIYSNGIGFEQELLFDPFVLNDQEPDALIMDVGGNSNELFSTSLSVISGVADIVFSMETQPDAHIEYRAEGWAIDGQWLEDSDIKGYYDPQQDYFEVNPELVGTVGADLDIDFVPIVSVCITILGCYDWETVHIPMNVSTEQFAHSFVVETLHFPLPHIESAEESHNFGRIPVGEVISWQLPISNLGELPLEGTVQIVGASTAFYSYPENVYAPMEGEDGIVVHFAPEEAGIFEAWVRVISNDPLTPMIEFQVIGNAYSESTLELDELEGNDFSKEVITTCGCHTQRSDTTLLWLGAVSMMMVIRRKENA